VPLYGTAVPLLTNRACTQAEVTVHNLVKAIKSGGITAIYLSKLAFNRRIWSILRLKRLQKWEMAKTLSRF
jgi:hypothetical protein